MFWWNHAGPAGIFPRRDTEHPYTRQGVEISVRWGNRWLEVGEAGLIAPDLLERVGMDPVQWTGWAMGWGLDRLVMARKGLPDIRLLRDHFLQSPGR